MAHIDNVTRPTVIMDIDGCVVTTDDVLHRGTIEDFGFWAERWKNDPDENEEIVTFIRSLLAVKWNIVYMTARPREFRRHTLDWLYGREIWRRDRCELLMVPDTEDPLDSSSWKASQVQRMLDYGYNLKFAIEDYPPMAEALREFIPVLLYETVKNGDH